MALGVVLMILVLTSKVANADNEGPSDVLKATWSQAYMFLSQRISPRCVRSCEQGAVDVYWKHTLGNDAQLLPKSKFMEILIDAYTSNRVSFVKDIRGNITLGVVQYLDADENGFISAEEYYTEFLCLGFALAEIKRRFDKYHTGDEGIPVSVYIATLVIHDTYSYTDITNETHRVFDEFQNDLSNNTFIGR